MWEYLSSLHPLLPYSLMIIAIIATVIIALRGSLMIKWGKNVIGIGNSARKPELDPSTDTDSDTPSNGTDMPPPEVDAPVSGFTEPVTQPSYVGTPNAQPSYVAAPCQKKRSCEDCLLIVNSEYEKYLDNKKVREDKILNYRMNYTEEKLVELENDITTLFEKRLDKEPGEKETYLEIESKMFYGLFKEILSKVKQEIRRSCKENGFCELSELEFSNYINDKAKVLLSILIREFKNIYPAYGTLVPVEYIIEDINSVADKFHKYVEDIFMYAKQVIEENEKEAKAMKAQYQEWASNFVK